MLNTLAQYLEPLTQNLTQNFTAKFILTLLNKIVPV